MKADNAQSDRESDWQKTSFANLVRYKPSRVYFARLRVKGKLIRRSLKAVLITFATWRLVVVEKLARQKAQSFAAAPQAAGRGAHPWSGSRLAKGKNSFFIILGQALENKIAANTAGIHPPGLRASGLGNP